MNKPVAGTVSNDAGRTAWPRVLSHRDATVIALNDQMKRSEYWDKDRRLAKQLTQLSSLFAHAYEQCEGYRAPLDAIGFDPHGRLSIEMFRKLPVLKRDELRGNGDRYRARKIPQGHGKASDIRTSGSTGMPLTASKSGLDFLYWDALTLREADWQQRDFSQAIHIIRRTDGRCALPDGGSFAHWGRPFLGVGETGPVHALDIESDIDGQLDWLARGKPRYMLTYPTNLAELIRQSVRRGIDLTCVEQITTVSECLPHDLRELAGKHWGARICDTYSSQETGYLALQAPEGDHYLVPEEVVYLEILDDEDQPVAPGEVGRVVVTPMHNFAMPLIRYEIGDYAEMGAESPCGRTLMVLNRIMGRTRGMLTLPCGRRLWPHLPYEKFEQVGGVTQYQLVQHTPDQLEMKCVVSSPMNQTARDGLTRILRDGLGYAFNVRYTEVPRIARSAAGKYEDFVSHV